jgi:hypothetical protein
MTIGPVSRDISVQNLDLVVVRHDGLMLIKILRQGYLIQDDPLGYYHSIIRYFTAPPPG